MDEPSAPNDGNTDGKPTLHYASRDWRVERQEAESAERAELRVSERNDGFRARTHRRSSDLQDLLLRPGETAQCDSEKYPDLAVHLERMESQRQTRIRRLERIEESDLLSEWIARRFVRIAQTFHRWLESTHRSYARAHESGYWAEVAHGVVECASSSDELRAAEIQLRVELEDLFKDPDWGRLKAWDGCASGRVPHYLFSGALWKNLFEAADRAMEARRVVGERVPASVDGGAADVASESQSALAKQEVVDGNPRQTRDRVDDSLPEETEVAARAELLPLLGQDACVFRDFLLEQGAHEPLTGPVICELFLKKTGRALEESDFRTRIVPRLKGWGLRNEPRVGYYFPADAPARRHR